MKRNYWKVWRLQKKKKSKGKRVKIEKDLERYYNAKVNIKKNREGELVLRNAQLTRMEQSKGKLSQNWKG